MDEVLLRRLLGAGTLLALALLFAALLPAPGTPGRDGVVAYDLQTGRQIGLAPVEHPPELKPEEHLLARPAAAPVETPADEPAEAPVEPPPPAPKPAVEPPLPRPALKVDDSLGSRGGWYVQVGSYSSQSNARNALQKLFGMGLKTAIQPVSAGQSLWYRVRVGPFASERAALEALARIKKGGYPDAKLVRPETAGKGN